MSAQQYLDAILIPLGLGVLLAYHAYLLYVIRRHPLRTVVGANNVNRRAWVRSIMKVSMLLYIWTIYYST